MNQPLPIREQLKALEQLQELDLRIDGLKKKKADLPQVLNSIEDAFKKARLAVDTKNNALAELQKVQRQTQAAVELNNDRLARANAKLESVQNSQEFQAANKEIDQLKKLNLSLDEQLKKSAQDTAQLEKDLGELQKQFDKLKEDREAQMAVITGQSGNLDTEISKFTAERKQFTDNVERRILSFYDRVRGARAGLGIVPAIGGRCSGCNMMVPPQLYNMIQRGQEMQCCPSCNRILYMPSQNGSDAQPSSEPQKAL